MGLCDRRDSLRAPPIMWGVVVLLDLFQTSVNRRGGSSMGTERVHRSKYWRMLAEELRSKADSCEQEQTKSFLREIAEQYDELAVRAQIPQRASADDHPSAHPETAAVRSPSRHRRSN
jgi:hypothetical protein